MSTEQYTYVGPYLRLYYKKETETIGVVKCPNGHKKNISATAKFCHVCGAKLVEHPIEKPKKLGFHDFLEEHPEFDHDEMVNDFADIPNHGGNVHQTIVCSDNGANNHGYHFCERDFEMAFAEEELDEMKSRFWVENQDLITELGKWTRVEVKFGVIGYRW